MKLIITSQKDKGISHNYSNYISSIRLLLLRRYDFGRVNFLDNRFVFDRVSFDISILQIVKFASPYSLLSIMNESFLQDFYADNQWTVHTNIPKDWCATFHVKNS